MHTKQFGVAVVCALFLLESPQNLFAQTGRLETTRSLTSTAVSRRLLLKDSAILTQRVSAVVSERVSPAVSEAALRKEAYLVLPDQETVLKPKAKQIGTRAKPYDSFVMGRFVAPRAPQGPTNSANDQIEGELFLATLDNPIRWNRRNGNWETKLIVGFDSPTADLAQKRFLPLPVQLLKRNGIELLEPSNLTISNCGPSGYYSVSMRCDRFTTNAAVAAHFAMVEQVCPLSLEPRPSLLAQILPAHIILAGALGGGCGAGLAWTRLRQKGKVNPNRRKKLAWRVVMAVGACLLVNAGLGPVLGLAFSMPNEIIGAFGLGGLVGLLGEAAIGGSADGSKARGGQS